MSLCDDAKMMTRFEACKLIGMLPWYPFRSLSEIFMQQPRSLLVSAGKESKKHNFVESVGVEYSRLTLEYL